jgi:thiamine-phosphate pyrophosphorylase
VRPLPRLHAITDHDVLGLDDFQARALAVAETGSAVALHARDHSAEAMRLTGVTRQLQAIAAPYEAAVAVNRRADIAVALGTQGLQLGLEGPPAAEVRRTFGTGWSGWIGLSVHSREEAAAAIAAGADFVMLGNVYMTDTHAGRPGIGLPVLREVVALGLPVIAIGGMTPDRAPAVRDAGAYGLAAIRAVWHAPDPAAATVALLQPWLDP